MDSESESELELESDLKSPYIKDTDKAMESELSSAAQNYPPREFFCVNTVECGRKKISQGIPYSWYVIKKSHGPGEPLKTVALACSVECMILNATKHLVRVLHSNYS